MNAWICGGSLDVLWFSCTILRNWEPPTMSVVAIIAAIAALVHAQVLSSTQHTALMSVYDGLGENCLRFVLVFLCSRFHVVRVPQFDVPSLRCH
jgi:hypothetical protein